MRISPYRVHRNRRRSVEVDGVVSRTVLDRVPPNVVYDTVPNERDRLEDVLHAPCAWGLYGCDETGAHILALER